MKRIIIMLVCIVLLSSFVIADDWEGDIDNPETYDYSNPTFYDNVPPEKWIKEVDWKQLDYVNFPLALESLEKNGFLSDSSFYNEIHLSSFLAHIPDNNLDLIDAEALIEAGHGRKMQARHIAANIDEVPDLKKLNGEELNKYVHEEYGVKSIDTDGCRYECTLKGGLLVARNIGGERDKLKLEDISGSHQAEVIVNKYGTIIVKVGKKGSSNIYASSESSFTLLVEESKSGQVAVQLDYERDFQVLSGRIMFIDGNIYVNAGEAVVVKGIGTIRAGRESVGIVNRPLIKRDGFSNKIYFDDEKIQLSGNSFSLLTENFVRNDPEESVRNGHSLILAPTARGAKSPSIITYDKGKQIMISGGGRVINGNEDVTLSEGRFLAKVVDISLGLTSRQVTANGYNLLPLTIIDEDNPEKKIVFENNNVRLGNQATYFSMEYDERLDNEINIVRKLGKAARADVAKPNIVVIGARQDRKDNILWPFYQDIWSVNRLPGQPTYYIDLDNEIYSSGGEFKDNEMFVRDLFSSQERIGNVYFFGHSKKVKDNYVLSVAAKGGSYNTINLPVNLVSRRDTDDPVFAGCASGDLFGSPGDTDKRQNSLLASYLMAQAKFGQGDYSWDQYKEDYINGRIKFPSLESCNDIPGTLIAVYENSGRSLSKVEKTRISSRKC